MTCQVRDRFGRRHRCDLRRTRHRCRIAGGGEYGKDQGIALLRALGNKIAGLPFTLVLDRQGNIVVAKRGIMTPALLQKTLDPLL